MVENPTLDSILARPSVVAGLPEQALKRLLQACSVVAGALTGELLNIPAPTDRPGVFTVEEAAEYLRVEPTWVGDKARARIIGKKLGAYWRFTREELDALLRKGCP